MGPIACGTLGSGTVTSRPDPRQPTERDDEPRLVQDRGLPALMVGGVIQSVSVETATAGEYWPAMLPAVRPRHVLLLGAGGGTLAALLTRRFGGVRILAVDDDVRVVALGRQALYLGLPNVELVLADAFAFCAACRGRFEFIAVDLFRGGTRPRAVLGRPFLHDLRRLAAPHALIAINLFRDRRTSMHITRIERVLTVTRRTDVGLNTILHCRVP
jgi:spermidine synthase